MATNNTRARAARAYMAEHPGTKYTDALRAVTDPQGWSGTVLGSSGTGKSRLPLHVQIGRPLNRWPRTLTFAPMGDWMGLRLVSVFSQNTEMAQSLLASPQGLAALQQAQHLADASRPADGPQDAAQDPQGFDDDSVIEISLTNPRSGAGALLIVGATAAARDTVANHLLHQASSAWRASLEPHPLTGEPNTLVTRDWATGALRSLGAGFRPGSAAQAEKDLPEVLVVHEVDEVLKRTRANDSEASAIGWMLAISRSQRLQVVFTLASSDDLPPEWTRLAEVRLGLAGTGEALPLIEATVFSPGDTEPLMEQTVALADLSELGIVAPQRRNQPTHPGVKYVDALRTVAHSPSPDLPAGEAPLVLGASGRGDVRFDPSVSHLGRPLNRWPRIISLDPRGAFMALESLSSAPPRATEWVEALMASPQAQEVIQQTLRRAEAQSPWHGSRELTATQDSSTVPLCVDKSRLGSLLITGADEPTRAKVAHQLLHQVRSVWHARLETHPLTGDENALVIRDWATGDPRTLRATDNASFEEGRPEILVVHEIDKILELTREDDPEVHAIAAMRRMGRSLGLQVVFTRGAGEDLMASQKWRCAAELHLEMTSPTQGPPQIQATVTTDDNELSPSPKQAFILFDLEGLGVVPLAPAKTPHPELETPLLITGKGGTGKTTVGGLLAEGFELGYVLSPRLIAGPPEGRHLALSLPATEKAWQDLSEDPEGATTQVITALEDRIAQVDAHIHRPAPKPMLGVLIEEVDALFDEHAHAPSPLQRRLRELVSALIHFGEGEAGVALIMTAQSTERAPDHLMQYTKSFVHLEHRAGEASMSNTPQGPRQWFQVPRTDAPHFTTVLNRA